MNLERALKKIISHDAGGSHAEPSPSAPSLADAPYLSDEQWADESLSELYSEPVLPTAPKHSLDFIKHRRKIRQLAETRLLKLAEQMVKLSDEIRYHDPLIAEVLDEAWDVTEEAIAMMQQD